MNPLEIFVTDLYIYIYIYIYTSGSYDSIYINAVFMRSFFHHTCLHIVWFLITRSLVKTYLHAGSC